jgi:hypothetical protein
MVKKSHPENQLIPLSSSKKKIWSWLFLCGVLALSAGIYFSYHLISISPSPDDYQHVTEQLQTARAEIQSLRQQLTQQNDTSTPTTQSLLANKEILGKISNNFQKIFIFSKLERRVLTGKNFSLAFQKLDQLMGTSLQDPQFNILRNNTQGITPPSGIETSFRAYTPPLQVAETGTLREKIFYFFNSFLKIRSFQEKEKTDTLFILIRSDHTKRALRFIEKNLPEYQDWSQALKTRLEAKQALRALEQLVFESLRI